MRTRRTLSQRRSSFLLPNVGLRPSAVGVAQALGLRWRDLDLRGGFLAVRYSPRRVEKRLTLVEPKTSRSRRSIDLTKPMVRVLEAHRSRQNRQRKVARARWLKDRGSRPEK